MQVPGEILKGIQLPSEMGVVVSRIYNWARELNEDVKPSSCFVTRQEDGNFINFFLDISIKLAESAGINIVISDDIEFYFNNLKAVSVLGVKPSEIIFTKDKEYVERLIPLYGVNIRVFRVADSLRMKSDVTKAKFPDHISIFESFKLTYQETYRTSQDLVIFDFSDVRDPDEISSGKDSFIEVCKQIHSFAVKPDLFNYLKTISDICSTIKRGGFRRHGATTSTIKSTHSLVNEYLDIPFGSLSHLKKGISLQGYENLELIEKICKKHSAGELFIEKKFGISQGEELFTNVCRGLSLIPGDRCLVSPVNLGQAVEYHDITRGFVEVTQFLIDVDQYQRAKGEYLPDKQVATGMTGLANCLRNFGTDYFEFIKALIVFNRGLEISQEYQSTPAYQIVQSINVGCHLAATIGKRQGYRAVLAIEPNASCSRRVKDRHGFDICPNIDPPNVVPGIGIERRHSETGVFDFNGNQIENEFNYGADIFPAQYLSFEQHFTLWNEMQKILDSTGRAHCGSYECWGELTIERFFQWKDSNLKTIYYNRTIGTKHLEKGRTISARSRIKEATSHSDRKELVCEIGTNSIDCPNCD